MNPILFQHNETAFATNGLGRMSDAISCTVEEERNGVYELEMKYPIDGVHFSDVALDMILYARHSDATDLQPFRIYRITKPINGIVTINARHISYDLSKVTLEPFTASTIGEAFIGLKTYAMNDCPFTFATDKTSSGTFAVKVPSSIRSVLGGTEGSILDSFGGGEYEWDKFTVRLHAARGTNSGVTIRYGKNLTDISHTYDSEDQYNGIVAYWTDGTSTVTLPEGILYSSNASTYTDYYNDENGTVYTNEDLVEYAGETFNPWAVPINLSSKFQTQPTVAQLRAAAVSYLSSTGNIVPDENIKIKFVQLWQTEEYKNYAPLQRVKLCDTVNVIYTKLGVNVSTKVVKTVYNVLLERYDSMELGDATKATLASTIAGVQKTTQAAATSESVAAAIQANSDKITGALGGYVVIEPNASTGYPDRILVMDTADTSTAMNVVQINNAGIGFSTTGINGPYSTAWTLDGTFTAAFVSTWSLDAAVITSGTMSGDRILGGTLKVGGTVNGTGGNGVLGIYNSSNTKVGQWDVSGLSVGSNFSVDMSGNVTASNATVSGTITTGALTATGGTIGGWEILARRLQSTTAAATTSGEVQYQVLLNAPATKTEGSNAIVAWEKPYGESDWEINFAVTYGGIVTSRHTIDSVERAVRMHNGRIKVYRAGSWLGELAQGVFTETGYPNRNAVFIQAHQNNVVGFAIGNTTDGTATPTFYYDPNYATFICKKNLYMDSAKLEISDGTHSGFAVFGINTNATFQMASITSGTDIAFYIDGGYIGSLLTASSDKRLKQHIETIPDETLKSISAVELKQFEFRKNKGVKHFGAVAQDVQSALDGVQNNVVVSIPSKGEEGSKEYLQLNYTEFMILRIAALEKRIKELETRMEDGT